MPSLPRAAPASRVGACQAVTLGRGGWGGHPSAVGEAEGSSPEDGTVRWGMLRGACATGEGAAGRRHGVGAGASLCGQEPGTSLGSIEQRREEVRAGDAWGKGFWAEGAASRRALDLLQGWVWGGQGGL